MSGTGRPTILLILQGTHHLDLFDALLTRTPGLAWVCLVHDLHRVPAERLARLHIQAGVRFFTDLETAMLHIGDVDALVTTFALPHRAHRPYLGLIALAYEMGMPVFELQHGLFQAGLSFMADGPLVGSGRAGAQDGLATRNLTDAVLMWWGAEGIGYPRYLVPPAEDGREGVEGEVSSPSAAALTPARRDAPIAVLTNLHWTLLGPAQAEAGYGMIHSAILALPDLRFALAPHPTEATSSGFLRLIETLRAARARNWRVVPATDRTGRADLMAGAGLAIATPSTVLLDLELARCPTLLLGLAPFEPLYASLERATVVRSGPALSDALARAVAGGPLPWLTTGRLEPFDPARAEARIRAALPDTPSPRLARDFVPRLYRYLTTA